MEKSKNSNSNSQELEESWNFNNLKKNKPQKLIGGGAFLSDEESSNTNSPLKSVSKPKILNGFMLSDEDEEEHISQKASKIPDFLSNEEKECLKSKSKISTRKYQGFGLISSDSGQNENNNEINIYSEESMKDSLSLIHI